MDTNGREIYKTYRNIHVRLSYIYGCSRRQVIFSTGTCRCTCGQKNRRTLFNIEVRLHFYVNHVSDSNCFFWVSLRHSIARLSTVNPLTPLTSQKKIASRQQRQQRQNTAGSDVHDTRGTEPDSESGRDVRACQENPTDAQALLREQVRRYNDLRIAYQSLTRRLETGGCSNGARRSGPDKGSSACLRQIKPESHGRRGVGTSGAPRAAGGDAPQTRSGKRPCCTGARSPRALGIRSERLG